jgi:DNA-binding response OmpR family regulator
VPLPRQHSEAPIRILLVEDNLGDAELLREALADFRSAHELRHVTTVRDGATLLRAERFDVVLLDLGLPDGTGLETVKRIHAAAGAVPIVVLTGDEDDALALACITAGAQDLVTKPALRGVMLRRVVGYAMSRQREHDIQVLEQTLQRYQLLSSDGSHSGVTRNIAGAAPVREREPARFREMGVTYRALLEDYVEHLVVRKPKPRAEMEALVTRLGDLGAGPRDLIDLHLQAMERALVGATPARANAYSVDGRLFALEMMGFLVDHYRVGVRRGRASGERAP